ncbi:MAG: GAF domain-containing SpoIIE family protein phosphatase [Chthoniobacteraceae bacterium]|jgi:sigma-B regulation protein RsbU (phosphoserine phosphatase)
MGWTLPLLLLLLGTCVAFYFRDRSLRRQLLQARRAREKVELEESRLFDFLHSLGEAFSTDLRPDDLHRLIVESAIRILDAHGGTLYTVNRDGTGIMARFISKSCPPLIEVPPHIMRQIENTPQGLQSYLRLHTVEPGESLVGKVWRDQDAVLLLPQDARLTPLRDTTLQTHSAMLAPLVFAHQNLGVIAVANGPMSSPFSESDFSTFKAIAEQSAFALYNAMIYLMADEKKRMDSDLQVAQEIQRILLPSSSPALPNYDIDGINMPARQMSGDYYGYIRVDPGRWGVVIADVSGKGVPASLIMAMCRSVLRGQAVGKTSAADVLNRVNRQLYPDIKEDMFVSMAYLILDENGNDITLCRAGHDAPLLYQAKTQTVRKLNPPGMAIGIDSGDVFERVTRDHTLQMETDDCLILYTDGITEALDAKGNEYGVKRMIQSIQAGALEGAADIRKRLTDDLLDFIGNHPQNDDITLIVIRKK